MSTSRAGDAHPVEMHAIMTLPNDAAELLTRAREGEREAFDRLLEDCWARLAGIIRLRLGRELREREEVDDILQETSLRAFKSVRNVTFDSREKFFHWLATIAERVIVDLSRRHGRRRAFLLDRDVPAAQASPSKSLRRNERFERLQSALDTLSEDHREVILLARVHGLPLKDVAARLGRSYGATAALLSRALRELRTTFGDTQSLHLPERSLGGEGDQHHV